MLGKFRTRMMGSSFITLLTLLDNQFVKEIIDDILDKIEDKYADSPGVMLAVSGIRRFGDIPDDIGGDED